MKKRLMNRIRNRIHDRRGFSLAEVLMAVLILLMVSSVIAAGLPLAANAYRRSVDKANAQVLLSTAVTALRTELSSSQRFVGQGMTSNTEEGSDTPYYVSTGAANGALAYYSIDTLYTVIESVKDDEHPENSGIWIRPYLLVKEKNEGGEYVTVYTERTDASGNSYSHLLVSPEQNLRIEFKSLTYANGLYTVEDLVVWRAADGAEEQATEKVTFTIAVMDTAKETE